MLRKLFVLALLLPSMAGAGGLEHHGTPVPGQPLVGPYSVAIPTKQGLKSILPPNWRLYIQETLALPEALAWDHSDTWVTVLESLAAAADVQITVDWTVNTVFVAERTPAAAQAPTPAPAPAAAPVEAPAPVAARVAVPATTTAVASDPAPAAAVSQAQAALPADLEPLVLPTAPAAAPAAPRWEVVPNTSLQATLREWSDNSGWNLQWDLDADLMMLTGFEHTGDFEGAVKALLAAVRSSGGPDIRAGLYAGNKTLRVHAPAF